MAEDRRLFFALWPDGSVRRDLATMRHHLPGRNGRLTHPEDLHITLVFVGSVSADRQACMETVADGIRGDPFALTIDRVGHWSKPGVLWCGPEQTPPALGCLVRDLSTGLGVCGFAPESRPYAPHVTLARKALAIDAEFLDPPLYWSVREFVLVSSRLGAIEVGAPRYEVLRNWTLNGESSTSGPCP